MQEQANYTRGILDGLPGRTAFEAEMTRDLNAEAFTMSQVAMAEHLGRIFEPFFSTKGEAGNGLGLALTKRIVEDHQGTLRLRSMFEKAAVAPPFGSFFRAEGYPPDRRSTPRWDRS